MPGQRTQRLEIVFVIRNLEMRLNFAAPYNGTRKNVLKKKLDVVLTTNVLIDFHNRTPRRSKGLEQNETGDPANGSYQPTQPS